NELAARRAFGDRSALGQRILIWGERVPSEVVGVVRNVHHTGLDADPRPEAWRPIGAVGWANLSPVVRGRVPPEALVRPVRGAVRGGDPRGGPGAAAGTARTDARAGRGLARGAPLHPGGALRGGGSGAAPGARGHLRRHGLRGRAEDSRARGAPRARGDSPRP